MVLLVICIIAEWKGGVGMRTQTERREEEGVMGRINWNQLILFTLFSLYILSLHSCHLWS